MRTLSGASAKNAVEVHGDPGPTDHRLSANASHIVEIIRRLRVMTGRASRIKVRKNDESSFG